MNLTRWETELDRLLDDLGEVQESMLQLLTEKRRCLAESDWPALTVTQDQETALLNQLEQCHQRRQKLLEQARQVSPEIASLERLARLLAHDSTRAGERRVRKMSGRMRLLQHESLTNWVVAQRALLHLSQLLEVMASGGRLRPTYGRETLPLSQGTLVDQEM